MTDVYEVAELDESGLIVGIKVVGIDDWVTDAEKRQVKLPIGHDMALRLQTMMYDFIRGAFFPLNSMWIGQSQAQQPKSVDQQLLEGLSKAIVESYKLRCEEPPADVAELLRQMADLA